MSIHNTIPPTLSEESVSTIPHTLSEESVSYENFIPTNFKQYNTLENLKLGFRKINQLKKTGQSTVIHNLITGDLVITCKIGNSMCILTTSTNKNTSRIKIEYFHNEKKIKYEEQRFDSKNLSGHLRSYLLTPEYLEELIAFEQQEQERKDALEEAHNSNPQKCDSDTCEHCSYERLLDWCKPRELGSYT